MLELAVSALKAAKIAEPALNLVAMARPAIGRNFAMEAAAIVGKFEQPSLMQLAKSAGAGEYLEDAAIEVFAHGTTREQVARFVANQGKNLSEHGGNFGGKLFTALDIPTAQQFAARTVSRFGGEPRVVGIAMPRSIAQALERNRMMLTRPIDDRNALQVTFYPSALPILRSEGFFFDLTKVLKEGVRRG